MSKNTAVNSGNKTKENIMQNKVSKFVNKPQVGIYDPEICRSLSWTDDIQVSPDKCILRDKYLVDAEFFNNIVEQYREIRPYLMSTGVYQPEDLIGQEYFGSLSDCDKRLAYLCLLQMSAQPDAEFWNYGGECEAHYMFGDSCP